MNKKLLLFTMLFFVNMIQATGRQDSVLGKRGSLERASMQPEPKRVCYMISNQRYEIVNGVSRPYQEMDDEAADLDTNIFLNLPEGEQVVAPEPEQEQSREIVPELPEISDNHQTEPVNVVRSSKKFPCYDETCPRGYNKVQEVEDHYNAFHLLKQNYFCKVCYRNVGWQRSIFQHVAKCAPNAVRSDSFWYVTNPTLVQDSSGFIVCLDPTRKKFVLENSQDLDLTKIEIQTDGSATYSDSNIMWDKNGKIKLINMGINFLLGS